MRREAINNDKRFGYRLLTWIVLGVLSLVCAACTSPGGSGPNPNGTTTAPVITDNWATYLNNNGRSGYDGLNALTPSLAPKLLQHWKYQAGSPISTQPVVFNGAIYWGSWDGYEHASDLNGKELWKTNLGKTTHGSFCQPSSVGIASTATITTLLIGGKSTRRCWSAEEMTMSMPWMPPVVRCYGKRPWEPRRTSSSGVRPPSTRGAFISGWPPLLIVPWCPASSFS